MLKMHRFIFNPFLENTYLIWDEKSNIAAIIDPGCYDSDERGFVEDFILRNSLKLKYLILTHCHIDHIFGNSFIKQRYNPVIIANKNDVYLLDLMLEVAAGYGVTLSASPEPDKLVTDNEEFVLGEATGRFITTPGHSPGGICLYFEKDKMCFTGDTLFKESIGRTDLWDGDLPSLMKSIKEKLFILPEEVVIYPGHQSESTIAHEKMYNPFLKDDQLV
jgi:glyoxylase-like metal-dependent hydrolase (beta-lactamase superfamily II)